MNEGSAVATMLSIPMMMSSTDSRGRPQGDCQEIAAAHVMVGVISTTVEAMTRDDHQCFRDPQSGLVMVKLTDNKKPTMWAVLSSRVSMVAHDLAVMSKPSMDILQTVFNLASRTSLRT
jgi:hypothetical protein